MTKLKYVWSCSSSNPCFLGLSTWPILMILGMNTSLSHMSVDYHPVIYWIFLDRGLDFFTKHQKYWLVKHIWFVLLSNSTNFQLYKMGFVLTAGVQNFVLCNLWIFSKENRMYNTICCTGSRRIVPSRIFAHHEILSSTITKDFCKFCFAQSSS